MSFPSLYPSFNFNLSTLRGRYRVIPNTSITYPPHFRRWYGLPLISKLGIVFNLNNNIYVVSLHLILVNPNLHAPYIACGTYCVGIGSAIRLLERWCIKAALEIEHAFAKKFVQDMRL